MRCVDEEIGLRVFEEGVRQAVLGAVVAAVARLSMTSIAAVALAAEASGIAIAAGEDVAAETRQRTSAAERRRRRWGLSTLPSTLCPCQALAAPMVARVDRCSAGGKRGLW